MQLELFSYCKDSSRIIIGSRQNIHIGIWYVQPWKNPFGNFLKEKTKLRDTLTLQNEISQSDYEINSNYGKIIVFFMDNNFAEGEDKMMSAKILYGNKPPTCPSHPQASLVHRSRNNTHIHCTWMGWFSFCKILGRQNQGSILAGVP